MVIAAPDAYKNLATLTAENRKGAGFALLIYLALRPLVAHLRPSERHSGGLATSSLERLAAVRAMMGVPAENDSFGTFALRYFS